MKKMMALALMAMMALARFSPAAIAQDDVNGMDDDVAGMDDDANEVDDDNGNGIGDDDSVVPQQSGTGAAFGTVPGNDDDGDYDDDANGIDDDVVPQGSGAYAVSPARLKRRLDPAQAGTMTTPTARTTMRSSRLRAAV